MMGSLRWRSLLLQEHIRLDAGLFEDSAERAFGHVAGMVGNGGVAVGGRVVPDLMAAWGYRLTRFFTVFRRAGFSCGFSAFSLRRLRLVGPGLNVWTVAFRFLVTVRAMTFVNRRR